MKRLETFGCTDIALRKGKKLPVLICDTPEHALQLLGRASWRDYRFRYKSEADHFQITLFIHRLGNISISIGQEHPAFPMTKAFETDFVNFITGALLPGDQLGYLKERLPLKSFYLFPRVRPISFATKSQKSNGPIKSISRLQQAFRLIFLRRLS